MEKKRIVVGVTGASGVIYAIRLLDALAGIDEVESHLILTKTGKMNIPIETDFTAGEVEGLADVVHKNSDIGASLASGSFRTAGMIVVPCAMKALSGIVHSYADDLLTRAADVVLKERRLLVLVPRESPLHLGHCKLLYEAAQLGAVIAPPMPAMYARPETIDDLVNHTVGRLLDLFGLDAELAYRWRGVRK